jgi:signal peptidase
MSHFKPPWIFSVFAALAAGAVTAVAEDGLFASKRLTPADEYTHQIEGPAVDRAGNLFVGNLRIKDDPKTGGAIGRIRPGESKSAPFATLPVAKNGIKSRTSGIRFDRDGRMYATDFNNHKIFVFQPDDPTPREYVAAAFHQPNDLAIARDGTLYASDPDFPHGTGRIWRITRGADGNATPEIMTGRAMGTTNGLDLSPDDTTLYVSESNTRQVWAYRIDGAKLVDARKIKAFGAAPPALDPDGLRTDVDGRIYVTQNGNGKISVLTPQGADARAPIATVGPNPSNLTFGGPDGRTVFVTQAKPLQKSGFIESFRVDRPGREPCLQFGGAFCPPP